MTLWTDPAGPNRRHAPSLRTRRDERARRGLGWASLIAALMVAGAALWLVGPTSSRHPMGIAHEAAGLTCHSCHASSQPPAAACGQCHGAHDSTRAGHARARTQGALACTDCHRIHQDFGGVRFEGGTVTRFGPGGTAATDLAARPELSAIVPVVPTEACARCHVPTDPADPIARCLDATGSMTLCFDEHLVVSGSTLAENAAQDRLVLWTLAREAVAAQPRPPSRPRDETALLWGVVALVAFVVVAGRALWGRPRRHRAAPQAPDVRPPERRRLPVIDTHACLGCSSCVDACPYDVLAMEDYVAKVARPQDCCGLTTCEERCPNGSLVVHDGDPIDDRPAVEASLESADVPGLYLAGDLTGMPLIRNAINQGAVAVQSVVAAGRRAEPDALDLLIVGAGPAGLSAALQAKKDGLRFAVLEQGGLAQGIASFPRGKLVFDQPLSVPLIGDLWLAESTKEDLLRHWTRIVRSEALPIHTHHRVSAVVRDPSGFWVTCLGPEGATVRFRAASVVLAIGRRGTPRKLDVAVPTAMENQVFYSLADARTFAQRRCVVVGLGDVAMEAALALSYAPGTTVTVVARGDDFRRGKARNIAAMRTAEAAGRLRIRWQSTVAGIEDGAVMLQGPGGGSREPADAVFVMIGAIAPWDFLQGIGVRRARENRRGADPRGDSRVEAAHADVSTDRPEGIA